MKSKAIAIMFVALITSACGTSRRVMTTNQPTPQNTSSEQGRIQRYSYKTDDVSPAETTGKSVPKTEVARPAISFSGLECDHVRVKGVNPVPAGGIAVSLDEMANEFCYPYRGKFISDYGMRSGRMHTGIDIKAVPNDTIRAALPGVVRMSKNYSSYGYIVVIRHYEGFETVYAHNSKNLVCVNDVVKAGDPIGLAGKTGRATTEHLHFEVRAGGCHIDPKLLVDPQQMALRTGWLFFSNEGETVVASSSKNDLEQIVAQTLREKTDLETARAEAIRQSTVSGKPKGNSRPEPVYYRVQKGDTLSGIARKNNTTVQKLCDINKIKPTSLLQINQRLRTK